MTCQLSLQLGIDVGLALQDYKADICHPYMALAAHLAQVSRRVLK